MSTPRRIEIYDTTLRDGTQGEGFNLSLQDKLLIAAKLDELGVDYIEGGFPLSNPKAEHFFDAYKANPAYAIRTLLAAQEAGASVLALCDTNGGTMPELIAEAVAAVKEKTSAMVGIHTHNDAGVAVANALTAIRNGAA